MQEPATGAAELANLNAKGDVRSVRIVHGSDLHLGTRWRRDDEDELGALRAVLGTAAALEADVVVLAGDVFDHNRLALSTVDATARLLGDAGLPVVVLPGNHDPATSDSIYRRAGVADPANVHVFGVTADGRIALPDLELELLGRAHDDYADMSPLHPGARRVLAHQVIVAHGHYVSGPADEHRSWKIYGEQIAATGADYVALGHWDRAVDAGDGTVAAYYSGSPHIARSVNLVRIDHAGVTVERAPLVEYAPSA